MYDVLLTRLRAMAQMARASFGLIIGIVLGVLIEWVKWARDNRRRWDRRLDRMQGQIDGIRKALGLKGSSTTIITMGGNPIGLGATADMASGGTAYFGAIFNATAATAGGIPSGPTARSLTDLYFHVSAALDSGTTLTITPEYSTDQSSWTQIGNQTLALSPSTGLTINQKLRSDGASVTIPSGAYVRFKAVATGDISSLTYGFWVG